MVISSRKKKGGGRGSSAITSKRNQLKIITNQEKRNENLRNLLTKEGKLLNSKTFKYNIEDYRNKLFEADEIKLVKYLLEKPSPAGSSSPDSQSDSISSQSDSISSRSDSPLNLQGLLSAPSSHRSPSPRSPSPRSRIETKKSEGLDSLFRQFSFGGDRRRKTKRTYGKRNRTRKTKRKLKTRRKAKI